MHVNSLCEEKKCIVGEDYEKMFFFVKFKYLILLSSFF